MIELINNNDIVVDTFDSYEEWVSYATIHTYKCNLSYTNDWYDVESNFDSMASSDSEIVKVIANMLSKMKDKGLISDLDISEILNYEKLKEVNVS